MKQPGLKCVVAWSERRHLCAVVEEGLRTLAGADEVRRLSDDACLVYTDLEPANVRDQLRDRLEPGESLLVVEFEKWSGYGAVDSAWLLRRGH